MAKKNFEGRIDSIKEERGGTHALVEITDAQGQKHCVRILTEKGMRQFMGIIDKARTAQQAEKVP